VSRARRRREQDRRGEHKKHASPERLAWDKVVKSHAWLQLDTLAKAEPEPKPKLASPARRSRRGGLPRQPHRPGWMEPEEYEGLLALKRRLL